MLLRENAKSSVLLRVLSGSRNDELQIEWRNGEMVTTGCKDYVAHFSVPPSQFWIDVRYTCSTIQLFQSEIQAEPWVSQSAGDEFDFLTSNEIGFRS